MNYERDTLASAAVNLELLHLDLDAVDETAAIAELEFQGSIAAYRDALEVATSLLVDTVEVLDRSKQTRTRKMAHEIIEARKKEARMRRRPRR